MNDLQNDSPFLCAQFQGFSWNKQETLLLLAKATYRLTPGVLNAFADEQEPLVPVDIYRDTPDNSSLYYTSDICHDKLATDIAIEGCAECGTLKEPSAISVTVEQRTITALLYPPRTWGGFAGIQYPVQVEGETVVPCTYEWAFGGADFSHDKEIHHESNLHNPVGCGFLAKKTSSSPSKLLLPQIENPNDPLKSPKHRPLPAGFGFIAPHWAWRSQYTGTYSPDTDPESLPKDFDPRFFNAAHPDLIWDGFMKGNEKIKIQGFENAPHLSCTLPGPGPEVSLIGEEDEETIASLGAMRYDKVFFDLNKKTVTILWRHTITLQKHAELSKNSPCRYKLA